MKSILAVFALFMLITSPLFSWQIIKQYRSVNGAQMAHVVCRKGGPVLSFEVRPNGKWVRSNHLMNYFNSLQDAANYWCRRMR